MGSRALIGTTAALREGEDFFIATPISKIERKKKRCHFHQSEGLSILTCDAPGPLK